MTEQNKVWPEDIHRNEVRGKGSCMGQIGRAGKGPNGECICPECGAYVPHQKGIPCKDTICVHCGTNMERVVEHLEVTGS